MCRVVGQTGSGVMAFGLSTISCRSLDDPGWRPKTFHGSNSLLQPPAIFGSPILELPVDAEIMSPMLRDIGIELRLPPHRDEVGLPILQDGFSLLWFENDTDRHRRN